MRNLLRLFLIAGMAALSLGSHAGAYQTTTNHWAWTHHKNSVVGYDRGHTWRVGGIHGNNLWMVDKTTRDVDLAIKDVTFSTPDGGFLKPTDFDTTFTIGIGANGCGALSVSQALPALKSPPGFVTYSVTPSIYAGGGCTSSGQVYVHAGARVSVKLGLGMDVFFYKVGGGIVANLVLDAELRIGPGGQWDVAPNPEFNGPFNWVRFTVRPQVQVGIYAAAQIGIDLPFTDIIIGVALEGEAYLIDVRTPVYSEFGFQYVDPQRRRFKYYTDHGLRVDLSGGSAKLDLKIAWVKIPIIHPTPPIWSESYQLYKQYYASPYAVDSWAR